MHVQKYLPQKSELNHLNLGWLWGTSDQSSVEVPLSETLNLTLPLVFSSHTPSVCECE